MIEYVLRVHSFNYGIWKHTGYSLYIKREDGTEILQTIDFSSNSENYSAIIDINENPAYKVVDAYGHETYWDNCDQEVINSNGLEVKELLSGTDALEAFNKIKLNAVLTNMSDKIDYDPISWETRVCNTATNYWANQYIPGYENKLVTDELSGWIWGEEDDYINASNGKQAAKLKFIENVVNILAQQGKVDEALSDTEPYLSEKYRQILEPILQRELFSLKDKVVEDVVTLVTCITTGSISLSIMCYMISQIDAQSTNNVNRLGAQSHQSPLVLDLDGDGVVETNKENSTVYFDHDNNGFAESTGWVGADDGLLVRDINNNGKIDNGTELFGNNSVLSSGAKAANGFEALADLDSNNDGVFDSSDAAWNQVKVWKDANENGQVDSGELLTLEQAA